MPENIPVRKILFSPNLKKDRFDAWKNTLDEKGKLHVQEQIGDVKQVFEEERANSEDDKPPFYSKLLEIFLEKPGGKLPAKIYEAYAPFLAAMTSIKLTDPPDAVFLPESAFSEIGSIRSVSLAIENQDPQSLNAPDSQQAAKKKSKKKDEKAEQQHKTASSFVKCGLEHQDFSTVIYFKKDQLAALSGPNRQLIVGPAGTGKTIVLRTKAVESLVKGDSVVVLAPKSYALQYKLFFDRYDPEKKFKYEIRYWVEETVALGRYLPLTLEDLIGKNIDQIVADHVQPVVEAQYTELKDKFPWMWEYDHVFVDDTFDENVEDECVRHVPNRLGYFLNPFFLMALSKRIAFERKPGKPEKIAWVAADPQDHHEFEPDENQFYIGVLRNIISASISNDKVSEDRLCSLALLNQVMRCPKSVILDAYREELVRVPGFLTPTPGNQIMGFECSPIKGHFASFDLAVEKLCEKVKEQIMKFIDENRKIDCQDQSKNIDPLNHLNNLAVLISGDRTSAAAAAVKNALRHMCQNNWPDFKNDRVQPKIFSEPLFPSTDINEAFNKNALIVEGSYNVSSLEFQWVFHVSCLPNNLTPSRQNNFFYQRYRAIGRTTAKYVDFSFTYDSD